MNFSGWIFMLVSWGAIAGLFAYCMVRSVAGRKQEKDREDPPHPSGKEQ